MFLLGALIVYRIGSHIPVPGIDPTALAEFFNRNQGGILGMFNMFSGGALKRFTIFALGIMPYISSSIIMQLMTHASPQLEALKKEGEAGRRKITQYTRYGTVLITIIQGFALAVGLESLRNVTAFEDPHMRRRSGRLVRMNSEFMAITTRFNALHRLLERLRARGPLQIVSAIEPGLNTLVELLQPYVGRALTDADALRTARTAASDAVECVMQSAASIDAGYKAVADVRRVALNTDARASAYLAYAAAVNDTVVRAPEGTGCTSSN